MPEREQFSNKGTFGKVLNFCGSKNYIGAAFLSAISSLKTGAGLSALATEQTVINAVASSLPDAVYLSREEGLKQINNYTVVLIGCGLGLSKESETLLDNVIDLTKNIPLIIDADGLNLLVQKEDFKFKNKQVIITPHPLEASRLLGVSLNYILSNLEDSAKALSIKYNCITVLKTHRTTICNKNLDIHINNNGNSALAKAGSGDVLAGIIAGLIAQKMDLFEACKLGVYLHAKTGELAAEELTEYSVLASELPKYIHKAIKKII